MAGRGGWLTPEEIGCKQFLIGRKGYEQDEVRNFLHRVALRIADLERTVTEQDAELAALRASRHAGDELRATLETQAEQLRITRDRLELTDALFRHATQRANSLERSRSGPSALPRTEERRCTG